MKFKQADPKVIAAFKALANNPHFMEILRYLDECKRYSDDEHRNVIEECKLHRNNGGALVVEQLIKLLMAAKGTKG